jgi:hypothetical protein
MPLSRRDIERLTECATKIAHLEETIKDLRQEVADLREEKKEHKERVIDRKLALYLGIAAIRRLWKQYNSTCN